MKGNIRQNSKFIFMFTFLFCLFITVCVVIGLFALAKYTKNDEYMVSLNFKKAVIEQEDITYTVNTETKKIIVQIAEQYEGKIQYKIGEDGIWTDYNGEFELEKSENIYAKLVFSDGEGPTTIKQIGDIIQGANVVINAQNMVVKSRIINAIRWCK